MDKQNFLYYQITTRTVNRFNQLDRWMGSNLEARIRIPGFVIDGLGLEQSIESDTKTHSNFLAIDNDKAREASRINFQGTNYYHLLGNGIGLNQFGGQLDIIKLQVISQCIWQLLNKYHSRIDFGLVGKDHQNPPSQNYIHLWGSNQSNISPDIINTSVGTNSGPRGGGQAGQFTFENTYIFGINTMADGDLDEVDYRAQTSNPEYLINYFNPSYLYDPASLPTSYSRYANNANSCFFAGLWAFLHKPENPVMSSILEQLDKKLDKKLDKNQTTLIHHLNQYYLNTHTTESNSKFASDLENFRFFLQQEYGFANGVQQDTSELINIIDGQIENIINPKHLESSDLDYFPTNDANIVPPTYSNVIYSMNYYYDTNTNKFIGKKTDSFIKQLIFPGFVYSSLSTIKYRQGINSIVLEEEPSTIEGNDIIVVDKKQVTTFNEITHKYVFNKKLVQCIYNPKYFSVYNKRFLILGEKDTREYPIQNSYGPFELYSIVVHEGGATGGHYTCYFKHNDQWYIFNDCGSNISVYQEDPTKNTIIRSNWVLLVYFKQNLNIPVIDIPIINQSNSYQSNFTKFNFTQSKSNQFNQPNFTQLNSSDIASQINKKYQLKPITLVLLTSLIIYLLAKDEELSLDEKKKVWLIGGLSLVISELISPDEPIEQTVSKFIGYLFELVGLKNPLGGGGMSFPSGLQPTIQFIIKKVTTILTEWYNTTDRSRKALEEIIERIKNESPSNFARQLEFAQLVKSPEYTLGLIKSNKSIVSKLDINQQIILLRGLGWKVNMTPLGPILIDWDHWASLLGSQTVQQINQLTESNSWVKYQIQSYIYNINLNHSNLLTGK